jgi:type IV pilus assembly protein PilB
MIRKKRLGDLLQSSGLIDDIQLRAALGFHNKWGVPLGQVVVDMGFCTAQQVLELLAGQAQLPVVFLDQEPLDEKAADLLPVEVAESCRVIPLRLEGPRDSVLVVAAAAPALPPTLDEVASATGKRVVALLATDGAISRAIERLYYPHLIGAQRPIEPIPLPEVDEQLQLVTDRAEYLLLGSLLQGTAVPTVQHEGLPVMPPLVTDLPSHARTTEPEMPRVQLEPKLVAEAEPEVWVYGWGAQATEGLLKLLEDEGFWARVARTEDVVKASDHTVVLAPLQSVEAVTRQKIRGQLLLVGRLHEDERAQQLGAQVFLSGRLDSDELIDEVRNLMEAGAEFLQNVG